MYPHNNNKMNKEYHKVNSTILGQDISINVYGTGGRPCLVFPSSEGMNHLHVKRLQNGRNKEGKKKKEIIFCDLYEICESGIVNEFYEC